MIPPSSPLVLAVLFARASAFDPLGPTGEYCGGGARVLVHSELQATAHVEGRASVACQFFASASAGGGALAGACRDDPALALAYDRARNRMTLSAPGAAAVELSQELCHALPAAAARSARAARRAARLPTLNISAGSVATAGCSHAGDFASQLHIAFSSLVDGACVFSGQPYHCAVERFARDYLVPQTPASGVPNCDGCPANETLLYDHCKNHPQYVDVGQLVDYPRRACGQNPIAPGPCIDDPKHLYGARAYLFRPTHDRCYLAGSVENTASLYGMLMHDPASTIKLVNDQPFPHTLPKNETPYFNHSEPAGFDGPGECLRWVYAPKFGYEPVAWAVDEVDRHLFDFDQTEFWDAETNGTGVQETGQVYIPRACQADRMEPCKLVVMLGVDGDFARYAESNRIVVLGLKINGGYVDAGRFPDACEVLRGLSDVYGQLSADYAMQSAYQMRVAGRILRRLLGRE